MTQKIRDFMTTDPLTLDIKTSIMDAARIMRDNDVGDVIVLDGGKLAGIVTDRDIVIRAIAEEFEPADTPLEQVCSKDIVAISPDETLHDASEMMRRHAVRRLPVVKDGKPVGIISLGDLAVQRQPDSPLGQVSSAPPNK